MRILVVDDDPIVRLGFSLRLKANEYEVLNAADGLAAIAQAREHMPDLILLDLGLPGLDGFGVLEILKADEKMAPIPVIVLSGRDLDLSRDRALKIGASNFLQKPVENFQLLKAIKNALHDASPIAPAA